MHMKAQRPIFVPREHQAEIERLSKAALMDMVWDYAQRCCGDVAIATPDRTMSEFRDTREIIVGYRNQAKQKRAA